MINHPMDPFYFLRLLHRAGPAGRAHHRAAQGDDVIVGVHVDIAVLEQILADEFRVDAGRDPAVSDHLPVLLSPSFVLSDGLGAFLVFWPTFCSLFIVPVVPVGAAKSTTSWFSTGQYPA